MSLTSIIIQSILIFTILLIGLLLYFLPLGKKSQNLPLCLFLIIVSLHILTDLTIDNPIFGNLKIHLIPSVFIFLYAPLLFFHANKLLNISINHQWKHFILFLVFAVYYLVSGFSNIVFFVVYGIQYVVYMVLVTDLIKKNDIPKPIVKIWIVFLVYSFGFIWFFAFAANAVSLFGYEKMADIIELISYFISILFFIGLIFFTMSQPGLFMNIRISKSNQDRTIINIPDAEMMRVDKIKSLFEKDKIFTNPELNRESLAKILDIDVQQLSKEINQHFKMNLSELIIQYRIKEAKDILRTDSLNIKEVYYQVGFNSRSVFNTAFKKIVKKTPSEYKKEV